MSPLIAVPDHITQALLISLASAIWGPSRREYVSMHRPT